MPKSSTKSRMKWWYVTVVLLVAGVIRHVTPNSTSTSPIELHSAYAGAKGSAFDPVAYIIFVIFASLATRYALQKWREHKYPSTTR